MPHSRRHHILQTLAYAASVAAVPALLRSRGTEQVTATEAGAEEEDGGNRKSKKPKEQSLLGSGKAPFDTKPRRNLAAENPEYPFFGDSMARAHIDAEVVSRLIGKKAGVFYLAHSTSARWYLMMKNYVIPSRVRPKKLFVLFRNCLWHMPSFRIEGSCWEDLERNMEDPSDPIIAKVVGLESRRGASPAAQWLRDVAYPVQTHSEGLREGIQATAARLIGADLSSIRTQANARTSWEHYRAGITAEANYSGVDELAGFSMDPAKSFFPHFLELAEQAGIPLHFIRIRRRPTVDGRVPNPEGIEGYMAEMKAELTKRGIGLTDCDGDVELKASMYAEGDHLDAKHRAWYTERLVKQIGQEAFA